MLLIKKDSYKMKSLAKNHSIILYDGVCGFCDQSIQFILKNKPDPSIRLVSFQSEMGKQLCQQFYIKNMDAIVLIENDTYYDKSTAVLKIIEKLQTRWQYLKYFMVVPKFIRDIIYNFIAKHRYRLMGKAEQCRILTKQEKMYFLE